MTTLDTGPSSRFRVLRSIFILVFIFKWVQGETESGFQQDSSVLASFSGHFEGREVELEKLIMDPLTSRLYVGAVNHLYDLSPVDLSIREQAVTGPKPDSLLCADTLRRCTEPLVQTNSYTKALAIDQDSNKLIECTSLYQGRCRVRNLSNIGREADVKSSRPGQVANDQHSSTVIFVGSGPTSVGLSSINQPSKVLYVASTYVPIPIGPRDALDVPAVSSLLLDPSRLFEYTSEYISSGTLMKLDYLHRPNFQIHYVGGFEANGFAYFATRQPKYTGEGQPTISKLIRVCTGDSYFYSYTEVPLECMKNGIHYNLLQDVFMSNPGFDLANDMDIKITDQVLFGVFTRGEGPERNVSTRESAICLFPIKQIEAKFFENIRECYNGNTRTNLPWFNSDKKCTQTKYPDSEIMCGKDVNSYIGGEIPIVSHAFMAEQGVQFNSIVATSVQSATVALVGTQGGQILKIILEGKEKSRIYKRIQLTDGTPLLQDVELDEKNGLLYTMSRSHVYKVNIRQCNPATDCHSCLEAGDPFCGWCMRQSQCVTEEGCIGGEIRDANNQRIGTIPAKNDWFNYRSGRCPLIRSIEPQEQQITSSKVLTISMENLPSSLEGFSCSFVFPNQQSFKIPASVTTNGVSCPTPTRADLKSLDPADKNNKVGLQARLTVLKAHDNSPLASTNFTFYDCHQLQTCTECASSRFPCDWCTISNKCVPNAEDVCQGEPLVNAVNRQGPSSRRGPEFCPRFTPVEDVAEIFVPSGHRRKLTLKVHNVHNSMRNFKCQYTVDQSTHERPATRNGDKIQCDELRFEYFSRGYGNGTARAEFALVWWPDSALTQATGGVASVSSLISSALSAPREPVVNSIPSSSRSRTITVGPGFKLDNSEDFHIIIYKCDQLASNCGTCLGLEIGHFECGWCSTETRCAHLDSCSVTSDTSWLTRKKDSSSEDMLCPFPRIDSFYPKKGPINGGTKITINGVNLGLKFSHVRDAVRVANVKCDVSEHDYVPSQKIVCHTRSPSQRQTQAQHVVIKLKDDPQFTAVSNDTFMYVNPKILSFRPFRGPRSGGTDITVMGEDLDSGASFNLTIGNTPCKVFQRSSTMVVCRTGPSQAEGAEYLVVNTDGTQVKVDSVQFQYTQNPIVDRVTRPVSIVSGGIAVDVFGKGLDLLQRPRMVVTHEDKVYFGQKCEVLDEHLMVCRTPGLDDLPLHRRASLTVDRPLLADYGFDLDGQLTGNLTIERSLPKLTIYDDPRIVPFGEILTVKPSGDLVIKGASLNVAASTRDVRVVVDGKPCNVTALASSTLTCLLHPELTDDDMEVTVFVGQRSERVGVISQSTHNSSSSLYVIAFVFAFIGIFMSITLICLYRRKNTSHNKQLRYLKNQMNSIEIKVAQECKAAFVELQTSMNAITHSVPQGGSAIPLLPYKDYAARILFPQNFINHPVLSELAVEAERAESIESGLRQLNRLLLNPNFLLSFVRTIDENKYLLLKDRVYVGSLIMVILQGHMEYCTEILKILLKELIRKNLDGKFQPKILFRRAESVAERMLSAWFSFLMHRFLEQAAGKELFQLYWSIKQQTEKGPQDAITMDARYSLSEEKLLRSSIEVNELTVYVLNDGIPGALYDVPVKVLDCDSIGQVKEKCLDAKYRTTPFSQRPHPNEVDIELRTPTHRMLLQDLDATSKAENGIWKYNTLAHYKIENKATLALIPRPASGSVYNLSMLSEKSDKSSPMSIHNNSLHQSHGHLHMGPTNSPTLSRPFGTTSTGYNKDTNNSVKVMHLVKPMDHGGPQDNEDKLVTEVYLTRLLTMKGTLKQFIKRNLKIILSVNNGVTALPLCIKYMFDFLDEQAQEHLIDDPDVVHAWKSNALPLRFWVNLIKNPDFIFDIPKPTKIEGSLNVVAQTLMDACSTQDQLLTKDSPSSKLLFADVMEEYKSWVQDYYRAIKEMPPVKEEQMSAFLAEESRNHANDFRVFSALNELYVYVHQNKEAVQEELSQNDVAIHQQLPEKFQKLLDTMEVIPDALIMNSGSLENYNSKSRLMSNSANRFY